MNTNIQLGNKYYKFLDDNTIEILRVHRFKNQNTLSMITKDGMIISKSKTELDDYVLLRPHGYMSFSIVELEQKMKDVIVTLHRSKHEIKNNDNLPYCVCRQNIVDFFANQIIKDQNIYIGVSVSKDTCPEDVPYNITVACNAVQYMVIISIYMDDTLDEILSIARTKQFDQALSSMYKTIVNNNLKGYCNNLKQLLVENYFMYDFLKGFDIYPVDFEIMKNDTEYIISNEQIKILEDILKSVVEYIYIIKYDYDIDMSKIERDYIMIYDNKNVTYIIVYNKGERKNESYEQLDDKRDYMMMQKYQKNSFKY